MNHLNPHLLTAILDRTAVLIEQGWCRGDYAKKANGDPSFVEGSEAVRFSIMGALWKAAAEAHGLQQFPVITALVVSALPAPYLPKTVDGLDDYNDLPTTTQADVLALIRRARGGIKQ